MASGATIFPWDAAIGGGQANAEPACQHANRGGLGDNIGGKFLPPTRQVRDARIRMEFVSASSSLSSSFASLFCATNVLKGLKTLEGLIKALRTLTINEAPDGPDKALQGPNKASSDLTSALEGFKKAHQGFFNAP